MTHSRTDIKPQICFTCRNVYTYKGTLTIHKRVDSGEKPYICKTYDYRLCTHGSLFKHLLIHANDKPHICQKCKRGFSSLSTMNDNIWTHADGKPRDKVLTRNSSSNHNARKNTHDTREYMYICSICDK